MSPNISFPIKANDNVKANNIDKILNRNGIANAITLINL